MGASQRPSSPSLLAFFLLVAVLFCSSLLAVDARRHRHLSRYVVLVTRMNGQSWERERERRERKGDRRIAFKKNEVHRGKKKTQPLLFFFSSSFATNNSEFPGLNDDAGAPDDALSTSATECDNTETGL